MNKLAVPLALKLLMAVTTLGKERNEIPPFEPKGSNRVFVQPNVVIKALAPGCRVFVKGGCRYTAENSPLGALHVFQSSEQEGIEIKFKGPGWRIVEAFRLREVA